MDAMATLRACAAVEAPLPDRIRTAAHQFAALIETLDALTPDQRCDLRAMPMVMLGWADEVEADL